jgi:cyclophilin family peptidyl-prolyl cis-trans isomerase
MPEVWWPPRRTRVVLCLAVGQIFSSAVFGQLVPVCACAHPNQPIDALLGAPNTRKSGEGAAQESSLGIELIAPATGEVVESRPAKPGKVDLGGLFPRLWSADSPLVYCAQAVADGARVGAPVVLVPMLPPRYAPRVDRDGTPRVSPPALAGKPLLSGYWVYTDQRVEITTEKGSLVFALHPEAAPNGVRNFRDLVSKGFYDRTPIHRIASISGRALPDIIQFGDPTGTGQGGPGYHIDFEPSTLKHAFGTLSYARTSDPNSASSQVFICLGDGGGGDGEGTAPTGLAAQLDGKYSAFATLVTGADTLMAIAKTPVDAESRPREPVMIESARLVDAPPFGSGPKPEGDPFAKPAGR